MKCKHMISKTSTYCKGTISAVKLHQWLWYMFTPGTSTVAKLKTEFCNLRDYGTSRTERQVNAFLLCLRPCLPTLPPRVKGILARGSACAHRTRKMHLQDNLWKANPSEYKIPNCKNNTFLWNKRKKMKETANSTLKKPDFVSKWLTLEKLDTFGWLKQKCMRTKVKREKDRVLNEATGQYEWVWVEIQWSTWLKNVSTFQ